MTDSLTPAMDRLSLNANSLEPSALETRLSEEANGTCNNVKPPRQAHQSGKEILTELENEFLTPSPRFSTKWLNRLQK